MTTLLLPSLALYFLPPFLLLFFYSLKKRNVIWLTIPFTAVTVTLIFWQALTYYETQGLIIMAIAVHTAIVSVITAAVSFISNRRLKKLEKMPPEQVALNSKKEKKVIIIVASVMGIAALCFTAHTVLSSTSNEYRQIGDRNGFNQLAEIKPSDVAEIEVFDYDAKSGDSIFTDYHGDKTFFADIEYVGSYLSRPTEQFRCGVSITLTDSQKFSFSYYGDENFQVQYKDRTFCVRSPQLLADITKQ